QLHPLHTRPACSSRCHPPYRHLHSFPTRRSSDLLQLNDDRGMPSHSWLYFVGDSSGKVHTTHQGKYDAREVGDVIVSRANGTDDVPLDLLRGDQMGPPQVVFCRPEAASVGITADQARDAGLDVSIYDQDLGAIAGSVLHSQDYAGQVRFIVDNGSNTL